MTRSAIKSMNEQLDCWTNIEHDVPHPGRGGWVQRAFSRPFPGSKHWCHSMTPANDLAKQDQLHGKHPAMVHRN